MALLASRARQRFSGLCGGDIFFLVSVLLLLAVCIVEEVVFVIMRVLVSGTGFHKYWWIFGGDVGIIIFIK